MVNANEFGWKKYEFTYLTRDGERKTVTVYASDDEMAAHTFDKVYGRNCAEVIS